jgi:hypothetical protein
MPPLWASLTTFASSLGSGSVERSSAMASSPHPITSATNMMSLRTVPVMVVGGTL